MMRYTISRLFAFIIILGFSTASFSAELNGSAKYVSDLGDRVIQIVSNKKTTIAQRDAIFSKMFVENFNVPAIARFTLGRHWREATPAEQQEYLQTFQQMIVTVYGERFGNYAGQIFNVTGSRPLETAGDELVHSSIAQGPGAPPVAIDWRVRNLGGKYQIIDVIVENISMSITQRNEFDSIIQANGGQIAGLLAEMKKRINDPAKAPIAATIK